MQELKWYSGFRWVYYGLKRSFNWRERATRAEYAWILLTSRIIASPIWFFAKQPKIFAFILPEPNVGFTVLLHVIYHVLLIPELSVSVRRLHDLGHSGFWLIPVYAPWLAMGFIGDLMEMSESLAYLMKSIFFDLFFMLVICSRIALSLYLLFKNGKHIGHKYGIDPVNRV
ncbi:DUF805 domain-containing protein [Bartonella sp. B12(2025)]